MSAECDVNMPKHEAFGILHTVKVVVAKSDRQQLYKFTKTKEYL